MNTMVLGYTPFPNIESATSVGKNLLERGVVACINIIPNITSMYIWNDNLTEDSEVVMILKTVIEKKEAAKKELLKLHPYETPCILMLDASANTEFIQWINGLCGDQN